MLNDGEAGARTRFQAVLKFNAFHVGCILLCCWFIFAMNRGSSPPKRMILNLILSMSKHAI
ncbi:hypothetical protein IC582_006127 [Cucumis melo]